ncbi:hypothetical protein RSOLAG22IIIB_04603 [Rhizoctonia solani]|uniref:37S ribosomal protein S18, mitochondrial n=1 Tax=Rhizoctonia solani TaxID=456999 RepID=A0A0K6FZ65_9AGAM|nr:hypothetical protein RSOLAG22IIIB_04603 [Rhizoctonia solani]
MSLARLRIIAPRLTYRAVSSNVPPLINKSQPQGPKPPSLNYDTPSTLEFLEMLARPPAGANDTYTGAGGRALRDERYYQTDNNESEYTRDLRPGSTDQVYHLYVKSTNNNTLITLTDPHGNALKGGSAYGGTVGFKGVAKSGYEAGYQCALRIFSRISELKKTVNPALGDLKIELHLNGMFGQGREAIYRALMTQEGEHVRNLINKVTDTSRIRVGGTRPKKRRIL